MVPMPWAAQRRASPSSASKVSVPLDRAGQELGVAESVQFDADLRGIEVRSTRQLAHAQGVIVSLGVGDRFQ